MSSVSRFRLIIIYKSKKEQSLKELIESYHELSKRLRAFYETFREQWFHENKPFGFEVQDIRIGGLITRVEHCTFRLIQYMNKETEKIDELEESLLDYSGEGEKRVINDRMSLDYRYMITPNVLVEPNAVFSCL